MWWLLADLLLHSTVILLAAELVCLLARHLAPAARYRIRLLAVVLVLVWPLLTLVVPQLPWSWFHQPAGRGSVTVESMALQRDLEPRPQAISSWPVWLWFAGFASWAAYYAVGYALVSRVAQRASALSAPGWISMLAALTEEMGIRAMPLLLKADQVHTPFVFGYRRKRILLPANCSEWTPSIRRSVLAHELAHLERGDLETHFLAQLVGALFWFQPLVWISLRLMRQDSEFACDQLVLRLGTSASDYAADLLNIASKLGDRRQMMASAIPMARTNLPARIGAVLTSQVEKQSHRTAAVCATLLVVSAVAVSALSVNETQNVRSIGGTMIRRLVPSALLLSAGVSAASIDGALYSSNRNAVANATATLVNSGAQLRQQLESDTSGKFSFQGLPAGQYTLRVDKPGFASLSRDFAIAENTHVDQEFTMSADAKQTSRPAFVRVGGNVAATNLVKQVQPTYPPEDKAARLQGQVVLEALISKEGVPQDISVVSSPSDAMSQSTLEAVRQWRYRPTLLNGEPIEVLTQINVNYTLTQ